MVYIVNLVDLELILLITLVMSRAAPSHKVFRWALLEFKCDLVCVCIVQVLLMWGCNSVYSDTL